MSNVINVYLNVCSSISSYINTEFIKGISLNAVFFENWKQLLDSSAPYFITLDEKTTMHSETMKKYLFFVVHTRCPWETIPFDFE